MPPLCTSELFSAGLVDTQAVGLSTDTEPVLLVRRNMSPLTSAVAPTRSSLAAVRLTLVASTLAVPEIAVTARNTSMPAVFSRAPSVSDTLMSPPVVSASSWLTANSRPVMPVPARRVSRLATKSTAVSAPPSVMLPPAVNVMLPAELTTVGGATSPVSV